MPMLLYKFVCPIRMFQSSNNHSVFLPFFIKAAQSLYLLLKSVHHFLRAYYIMHLIGTIMNELTKDRLRENLESHTVYAYLMEINCWGNLCV